MPALLGELVRDLAAQLGAVPAEVATELMVEALRTLAVPLAVHDAEGAAAPRVGDGCVSDEASAGGPAERWLPASWVRECAAALVPQLP
eukprot:51511-Prymnesium_polylepis.1